MLINKARIDEREKSRVNEREERDVRFFFSFSIPSFPFAFSHRNYIRYAPCSFRLIIIIKMGINEDIVLNHGNFYFLFLLVFLVDNCSKGITCTGNASASALMPRSEKRKRYVIREVSMCVHTYVYSNSYI